MIENRDNLAELPKNWMWTKLGEIVGTVEKTYPQTRPGEEFLYLDIASIDNKKQKIVEPKRYLGREAPSRARQLVKSGDILFSTVRTYLKNIAMVNETYDGQIASTGFCVIRPYHPILSKFMYYWVQTDTFLNTLNQIQRGTSYPAVRDSDIFTRPVPFCPPQEQHRIVAKIEELFTRLDAGEETLGKVKAQLKHYRQAVLKYAFEGKLTEEWREAQKGEMEPASALLERIREERKKNAKGKLKELPSVDTSDLPELPEGWGYLILDYLVGNDKNSIKRGPFGSSIKKAFFVPYGYKVYEQGNVIYNDFERGGYFIDDRKFNELKDFEVKAGDVLMSCSGTVGKIAIVPEGIQPGVINQALLRITLDNEVIDTLYFTYLFRSRIDEIMLKNTRGSAMVNMSSARDLRQIPLPIPSLAEQRRIVEEIERCFSVADEIEKVVEQSLKRAQRLRQSILKRAFEGKLVPQDPNDESTEKLLKRISAEKAKREVERKATVKGGKKLNTRQRRLI